MGQVEVEGEAVALSSSTLPRNEALPSSAHAGGGSLDLDFTLLTVVQKGNQSPDLS